LNEYLKKSGLAHDSKLGRNDKEKREIFFSDYNEELWGAKTIFILDKPTYLCPF
jgi:hypothetical protein